MIELVGNEGPGACIKVIGMGGGGGNAVNTMIASGLGGVEFVVGNTDAQALTNNLAAVKIQLGKGLGAGARPDVGRAATEEHAEAIREQLAGADMVFITAGMGGGTGTGGAPVVGRIARELGALSVGVVTKPFAFEGKRRAAQAEEGIKLLQESVDTLIVIPNERLLATVARQTSLLDAFRSADDVLLQAVRGISDLVTVHGLINLDFADVRTIMSEMGMAIMGCGVARGEGRAIEAAQRAISSPLLEGMNVRGARGVLINITGSADLALHEINEASSLIQEEAHDDANIIFGAVIDESMGDELRITVIATGFSVEAAVAPAPVAAATPVVGIGGSRPVAQVASRGFGPESIRRVGAPERPIRRVGRVVEEGGELRIQACENDTSVPDGPSEFTIDPINDEDAEHDYESPAFLRRAK
ncbi:MAG TPA: cell division protein FtsZ [Candidatus Dormibacteraeota bacterium]|nr:cell division protein FtsZ [Candidatus Dormibacteraeota bacterium]